MLSRRDLLKVGIGASVAGTIGTSLALGSTESQETKILWNYGHPIPNFDTSPWNKFWLTSRADFSKLRQECPLRTSWDFNSALGDTVREKFRDLSQIVEHACVLLGSPHAGIVASPEVSSIFEVGATTDSLMFERGRRQHPDFAADLNTLYCRTNALYWVSSNENIDGAEDEGNIWMAVRKDPIYPQGEILVVSPDLSRSAKIVIENFIV